MSSSVVPLEHESSAKVLIYESEARQIAEHTDRWPDLETGGDLFGYWTHSHAAVISFVVGPGSSSRHGETSFYQDEFYLQDLGADLFRHHGLQHIGAWHSHHQLGLNEPSSKDIRTVQSGIRSCDWSRFLLMITTLDTAGMVFANYYMVLRGHDAPIPLRIIVLPGISPFRQLDLTEHDRTVTKPVEDVQWRPGPFTPVSPSHLSVDDVAPSAWFTSIDGKDRLRGIVQGFADHRTSCRIFVGRDRKAIRLVLPDCELLLLHGFPESPPLIVSGLEGVSPPNWTSSISLVDWYFAIPPFRKEKDDPGTLEENDRSPTTERDLLEHSEQDVASDLVASANNLHFKNDESSLLDLIANIGQSLHSQHRLDIDQITETNRQLATLAQRLKDMNTQLKQTRTQHIATRWIIVIGVSFIVLATTIIELLLASR